MVYREYSIEHEMQLPLPEEMIRESVFFDIETTGFLAASSHVYLIGAAWRTGGKWKSVQWMSELPKEESDLLRVFARFLEPFRRVIHFNGDRFDVPYMREKYALYGITDPFEGMASTDIYRDIKPLKKLLSLQHMNQKSLERFLGIRREDRYDGGQLIQTYRDYCRRPSGDLLSLLLLHNREDVEGMLHLTRLYTYLDRPGLKAGLQAHFCEEAGIRTFVMQRENGKAVPVPVNAACELGGEECSSKVFLEMNGTQVRLKIGALHDRLCFFLDNYREYDYLPQEDMAVHKSVSCYVDRKYRKQATAKTCYVRQEGYFLPQTGELVEPALRRSYSDKLRWFKADDALCLDEEFVSRYFDMIFEYLMEHAVLRRDERYE